MVNATRPEASLCDLETAAFAEQHVRCRNADILEQDFGMAVRRVVIAEHGKHAQNFHTGRIERHDDLRLLPMLLGVRVGLAHDDRDLAMAVADT